MIQAYRRGLLMPELPFGPRSRLRETLVLELLESEIESEAASLRTSVAAAIVGPAPLSKAGRQGLLRNAADSLRRAELIRIMDFDQVAANDPGTSALAIASVYEMLQRSGALNDKEK